MTKNSMICDSFVCKYLVGCLWSTSTMKCGPNRNLQYITSWTIASVSCSPVLRSDSDLDYPLEPQATWWSTPFHSCFWQNLIAEAEQSVLSTNVLWRFGASKIGDDENSFLILSKILSWSVFEVRFLLVSSLSKSVRGATSSE